MSLNGTSCHVDIYEEGYTGNTVTELSENNANAQGYAAAVPFEFQEDDSNDLTHFIRYKTGYIRLVEASYGSLTALFPTSIRHHFVEAYYGNEIVFTGFMQCQEFDNDWVAAPRELEFPVISPLGLLDSFEFEVPSTPGLVTLGSLMSEVMIGLNPWGSNSAYSDYDYVIYPGNQTYEPWSFVINSLVICPFNDTFKHYDSADVLYSPKDYKYFIEGICACFGWTVHDTPSAIVFAQYDWEDPYSQLSVSGLTSLSGVGWVQQRSDSFNYYYSNADGNAMQSVIMPLKKMKMSLEGVEIKKKELSTKHCRSGYNMVDGGPTYRAIALLWNGPEVDGGIIGEAHFDTGGNITNNGLFPIGYGKIEPNALTVGMSESWVLKYNSSWSSYWPLISVKFFGMPPADSNGNLLLKLKMERGTTLQNMKTNGYNDIRLNLVIKVEDKYVNVANGTMSSSYISNAITIDGSTGKVTPNKNFGSSVPIGYVDTVGDLDGIFFNIYDYLGMVGVIEVMLYDNGNTNLNTDDIIRFTEFSIENPGHIDEPFDSFYRDKKEFIIGDNGSGTEERIVTVNFNNYSYWRGEHSFGRKGYLPAGQYPTFPYMFAPLHVLTEKVKMENTPNFNEYAAEWTYWINGWRWRMLAKNFNLRDDLYTITLARSSTIE